MHLAAIGEGMGLPVGKYSKTGELMKFTNKKICEEEGIKITDKGNGRELEVAIMNKDIVSDVGGFMYAESPPVRRTSLFKTSYMIPSIVDGNVSSMLESQFHVRYFDPSGIKKKKEEKSEKKGNSEASSWDVNQSIFNIETSSTLYSFTFILDEKLIGVPTVESERNDALIEQERILESTRKGRVEASVKALYPLISMSTDFGAKSSRYYPNPQLQSLVCTYSKFPFVPEPSNSRDYIDRTISRIEKADKIFSKEEGRDYSVFVMDREDIFKNREAKKTQNVEFLEELISGLLERTINEV